MSPTIFRNRGYRFLFFSREEPRKHIHVQCSKGEAKFWLEPALALCKSTGLSRTDLRTIEAIIKEHLDEIEIAWRRHFNP